jgi:hypothetical protein
LNSFESSKRSSLSYSECSDLGLICISTSRGTYLIPASSYSLWHWSRHPFSSCRALSHCGAVASALHEPPPPLPQGAVAHWIPWNNAFSTVLQCATHRNEPCPTGSISPMSCQCPTESVRIDRAHRACFFVSSYEDPCVNAEYVGGIRNWRRVTCED